MSTGPKIVASTARCIQDARRQLTCVAAFGHHQFSANIQERLSILSFIGTRQRKFAIDAVLLFVFSILASESVALASRLEPWAGRIDQDIVSVLPGPHAKAEKRWPFVVGILDAAAHYDSFRANSGVARPTDPDIDWRSELMVFAIWPRETNRVGLSSWQAPTDGTGTLNLVWSGIDPFYPRPVQGTLITNARFDITFVSDGNTPAEEIAISVGIPVDNQRHEITITGEGLGFGDGPGCFTGSFETGFLNGEIYQIPGFPHSLPHISIDSSVDSGVVGYFEDSFVTLEVIPITAELMAGNGDRDFDFDQLDILLVQQVGKYLTGDSLLRWTFFRAREWILFRLGNRVATC